MHFICFLIGVHNFSWDYFLLIKITELKKELRKALKRHQYACATKQKNARLRLTASGPKANNDEHRSQGTEGPESWASRMKENELV